MKHTDIKKCLEDVSLVEKKLTVCGWVRTVRNSKGIAFVELNDGTCFKSLQLVVEEKSPAFSELANCTIGSALKVNGTLKKSFNQNQSVEFDAEKIEVLGKSPSDYPLQKKGTSREFLREISYLRPRTNLFNAVFRIRSVAAQAIHDYFQSRGYIYVHTPLITCSDCEGSDQMFKITALNVEKPPIKDGKIDFSEDLFGQKAFITGSGQLHGEAFAMAFSKIYTFGPTFRTENSNTKTHANEFWMIEPEIAFCDINELMDIEEEMLKSIVSYVIKHCPDELAFCDKFVESGLQEKLSKLISSNFVRVDHEEVIKILQKSGKKWEFEPKQGEDIAKEHERYITEYYGGPVFIKNWPKDIKAYYMKLNPDGKTVASVDLEVPLAGELMGGSEREIDYDKLKDRMKNLGVEEENIWWYMNLRKFGTCEHSGFGMGFERLVMYLTGVDNIRDVSPFPRTPGKFKI